MLAGLLSSDRIRRGALIFTLGLFGFGLAGCDDGDDGRDGSDGAAGLACWDLNENGIPDFPDEDTNGDGVIDVNDCRGDSGSSGSGDLGDPDTLETLIAKGEPIVVTITDATVASPPVLALTVADADGNPLTNLGEAASISCTFDKLLPAADGFPTMWESYINIVETDQDFPESDSPNLLARARQAAAEGGTLEEPGTAGEYEFTYTTDVTDVTEPFAVSYQPSLTHRAGCEVRFSDEAEVLNPDNPYFDFVPAGGEVTTKKIVDTATCNDCHGRLAIHGDGRFTTDYCQACHNPYTRDQDYAELLDLGHMAHAIHAAGVRTAQETNEGEFAYKVLGFGERFSGDAATDDYSHVTYPQAVNFCETCHSASNEDTPDGGAWEATATAEACGACHVSGLLASEPDPDSGLSSYSFQHPPEVLGGAVVPSGNCGNCHGDVDNSTAFIDNRDVHNKGAVLEASLGEDFVFAILAADNLIPGDRPVITYQVSDADGNLYDVLADPEFDSANGARIRTYFAWTTDDFYNGDELGNLVNGGRAPGDDHDEIIAASVKNNDGSFTYVSGVTLPADYSGDGMVALGGNPVADVNGTFEKASPQSTFFYPGSEREQVVAIEACDSCHENLTRHFGGYNSVEYCLTCHNNDFASGSNDRSVALSAIGHGLHAGITSDVTYPREISDCYACHTEDGIYGRETARAVSSLRGAEANLWLDDTATTSLSATCGFCHTSNAAAGHFASNGGQVDELKSNIIGADANGGIPIGQEACLVCHGPGRSVDVAIVHGLK